MSPTYGYVTKLFLEEEFQHKGDKQIKKNKKNANSQQNIVIFLAATDSEKKIIQILHRKGQKNYWTKLSSLGQEPTFNVSVKFITNYI